MSTSAEEASRWLEVADDFDIELNDLSDAFNNVAGKIAEGDDAIDDLGVTIERTATGAVDMDLTMRNVIEAIAGIEDPAERARISAELLGEEGSRQFAELTGEAGRLTDALDGVSERNLVTDDQVEQARRLRDTMEELSEAGEAVQLAVGSELVEKINQLTDVAEELEGPLTAMPDWLTDIATEGIEASSGIGLMFRQLEFLNGLMPGATTATGTLGDSITQAGLNAVTASGNVDTLAASMENATVKTVELFDSINQLPGEVPIMVDIDTSAANARLNTLVQRLQDIGSQATVASAVAANRFNTGQTRSNSTFRQTGRPELP
jgi:hypothetical protein